MNVQFGASFNSSLAQSQSHNSEARPNIAAPADADSQSTTSFTPVEEVAKTERARQEDARQVVETRDTQSERRSDRKSEQTLEEETQQARREQKQLEDAQQDRALAEKRAQERAQAQREAEDLRIIQKLAERDREVRAHEQAHQSVGGEFTGAASFTYERGPDGQNYAVGGEVPIDASKITNDPEATLSKAETIRRAALAPAEPSAQDRRVAAQASQLALEAQAELQQLKREELQAEETEAEEDSENEAVVEEERQTEAEKAQKEVQEETEDLEESLVEDLQAFNERLARVQAQLDEISQLDDRINASANLLDATI